MANPPLSRIRAVPCRAGEESRFCWPPLLRRRPVRMDLTHLHTHLHSGPGTSARQAPAPAARRAAPAAGETTVPRLPGWQAAAAGWRVATCRLPPFISKRISEKYPERPRPGSRGQNSTRPERGATQSLIPMTLSQGRKCSSCGYRSATPRESAGQQLSSEGSLQAGWDASWQLVFAS